jgi:hypothetical protein
MTGKRISYNWLIDMFYTMFWAILITTIFVCLLQLIMHPGKSMLTPILAINGLFVPIITIFIGLRPVISLFVIPDTLHVDKRNRIYLNNREEIEIETIAEINVKQIGVAQSHLIYYELILRDLPESLQKRKRKSLIVLEPYNIKHTFQTRLDFLSLIADCGLSEDKIQWDEVKIKHMFGMRDKFRT